MLQNKHKDLEATRQRRILTDLVNLLAERAPDLYYQPSSEVARQVHASIQKGAALNGPERELMRRLSAKDIAVMLSHH